MLKRLVAVLCALMLLASVSVAAMGSRMAAFSAVRSYEENFSDLTDSALWYYSYAVALYEHGLSEGRGDGSFAPAAEITLAELLTFSARIRAQYENGSAVEFPAPAAGEDWYAPYVAYLKEQKLLAEEFEGRYTDIATRAEMAGIFYRTLPVECYDGRNAEVVTDGYALGQYILDVDDYTPYQPEILWLYKQGILNGTDERGRFAPQQSVTRAEVAAMLTRMIDPTLRLTLAWEVRPYPSAVGTTYASLVPRKTVQATAPAITDTASIDALICAMLAEEKTTLSIQYPAALSKEEASALASAFAARVKIYCEQMYNRVLCTAYSTGRVELAFSSACCTDSELAAYRRETLREAITVHDALWESGYLYKGMSEYEKAKAYYLWLCSHCGYDAAATDTSLSHLAYSVFRSGTAVCDGYVGAYNLLLKMEGIDCSAMANADHIWTRAVLDGREYHIDPTWGDAGAEGDLSYFAMTAQQSYAKHPW